MHRHLVRPLYSKALCTRCANAATTNNLFTMPQSRKYITSIQHTSAPNRILPSYHQFRRVHQHQRFSDFAKSEYIHPLSQIVLEHLQSNHSDWIQRMGLDRGLELKKDGTFVLRFDQDGTSDHEEIESIWTMYEPTEKKHYLCISKNKLVGRYLLQDNTKPAWHTDKKSLPERVQEAVDEMVVRVNETC